MSFLKINQGDRDVLISLPSHSVRYKLYRCLQFLWLRCKCYSFENPTLFDFLCLFVNISEIAVQIIACQQISILHLVILLDMT